ncbi:hypothetical protein [Bradyrhizobium sp. SZCCHNR2011]|uniref:hypothetical protein n=1 Tax=Bradyrhizobium sp. SZCCHNR2011 TaxID=3057376 RepID=UPI0028E7E5AE|nr:hypothetical protein [Bradyrhizobium sp. SZCCHNR2011]
MAIERSMRFIFPYISRHFRRSCVILAAHERRKALKSLHAAASRRSFVVANHCQNSDSPAFRAAGSARKPSKATHRADHDPARADMPRSQA